MYILSVVPITKIPLDKPQTYTYFTSYELTRGSLVLVPLYKRQVKAIVLDIKPLDKKNKIDLRKSAFGLKQIVKVLCKTPLLTDNQLKLIQWMAGYYYAPLGLIVKTVLPEKLIKNIKAITDEKEIEVHPLNKPTENSSDKDLLYVFNRYENRIEQYLKEIKATVGNKKQVLILAPQVFQIEKIKTELRKKIPKTDISTMSSELKITELRETWLNAKKNDRQIIIGTRSAIFLPFKKIGLIIIDEEENSGHISWDMAPKYDARKLAEKLAELFNAKLILGSSTPSVEYYHKLLLDKSQFNPPNWRTKFSAQGGSALGGKIQTVDMRQEIRKENYSIFSETLRRELEKIIKSNKQVILFVNRRGSFRSVVCRDCGWTIKCRNCEIPMVGHEQDNSKITILKCHHCGEKSNIPTHCQKCGGLRIKGFGIGTQRVEQEVKKLFPKTGIARIDSDTTKKLEIQDSKLKIIIGTQMIFSLPDLKKVSLVGIIAIDSTLNLPDFRSGEKTFQMLSKLINLGEKVLIQTYNPDSFVTQAAIKKDYRKFYDQELSERKTFSYPPFSQIIKLTHRNKRNYQAENQAENLKLIIDNYKFKKTGGENIEILGPSPAFNPKERGLWTWRIIVKLKTKNEQLKTDLLRLVPSGWEIEINPESML